VKSIIEALDAGYQMIRILSIRKDGVKRPAGAGQGYASGIVEAEDQTKVLAINIDGDEVKDETQGQLQRVPMNSPGMPYCTVLKWRG